MSMWLGMSRPTGGLTLKPSTYGRILKTRTPGTVLRARTTPLRVYSSTPLRYAPGSVISIPYHHFPGIQQFQDP
ncbi:hypothetical protein Pyn_08222 [Prunus yedoensis var. nudiflora]|uniref:Uncharacterized protein n=1 Tax=Prunus yedoensis var. nudiflora TaxID=2094558 RepID=A0A314UMU0_PRUYE|nr:hypothetical protein Pyn_08222 [Prunus yedoensis var. nudiflora]